MELAADEGGAAKRIHWGRKITVLFQNGFTAVTLPRINYGQDYGGSVRKAIKPEETMTFSGRQNMANTHTAVQTCRVWHMFSHPCAGNAVNRPWSPPKTQQHETLKRQWMRLAQLAQRAFALCRSEHCGSIIICGNNVFLAPTNRDNSHTALSLRHTMRPHTKQRDLGGQLCVFGEDGQRHSKSLCCHGLFSTKFLLSRSASLPLQRKSVPAACKRQNLSITSSDASDGL